MMQSQRWHSGSPPASSRAAGLNHRARIVDLADRPLILLHDLRGGTIIDLVVARDGELLRLASGAEVLGRLTIAPAEAAIPFAMPYWAGPGAGLWEAAVTGLSTPIRQQAEARPGAVLTKQQREQMVERLFAGACRGVLVIAGRSLPVRPSAGYVAFDPAERAFWVWDFVTEQAFPRLGTGAEVYGAVRVIATAEWNTIAAASVHPDRAPLPPDPDASIRPKGAPPSITDPSIRLAKPGPRPRVKAAVIARMRDALAAGEITLLELASLRKKEMPHRFGAGETTCMAARAAVLETATNCDRTATND